MIRRLGSVAWTLTFLFSGMLFWLTGRMQFVLEPDSNSYLNHDLNSLSSALSGIRTPGYPIFLQTITAIGGIEVVPIAHWLAQCIASLIFLAGLVRAGVRPTIAVAASLPLMFSRSLWDFGPVVASDSLAVSIAISACGVFFMTLGSNAKPSTLIALSIVTFLAYFVRPAFLFLVVLWPTLGPWLTYFLYRQNLRVTGRTLVIYLLVVLLPLTAYAALRRSVMGEFGVVSFTGYNLIGVSGQFLTSEDVSNLPEECRSLAQGTIDRRVNIDNYSPPVRFETMVFLFNATVWKSAAPAAEALYGSDTSRSNRELLQLATELIRLHPDQYRNWLIANAQHAIDQWLKLMATDVGTRLVLLTGVAFMFFTLLARRFRWRCLICDTQDNGTLNRSVDGGVGFEVALLFWTMMVYSLGTIMLVILVEPANGRYVSAAMCLTPSFIGACLASLCIEIVCGHNSVPNCKSKPVN